MDLVGCLKGGVLKVNDDNSKVIEANEENMQHRIKLDGE